MKKIVTIVVALAALCMMSSCGGSSTPGAAAKRYVEYVIAEDYDKFVDGIALPEEASQEEIEEGKAMVKSLLVEKAKPQFDEKGGLKSVEVVSETIAEDGQSATVELRYSYGDGSTSDETSQMVLVDGEWKMKMGK